MEFEYIEHRKGLPLKLFLVSIGHRSHHFHSDLEIIHVFQGNIQVHIGAKIYALKKGDFLIINPYEIHSFVSNIENQKEQNILLILQINTNSIAIQNNILSKIKFTDPFLSDSLDKFRNLLYEMILESTIDSIHIDFLLRGYMFEFIAMLLKFARYEEIDQILLSSKIEANERIHFVINYVEKNFKSKILLEDIAAQLHISKYHLSHFIRQSLGINFQTYLNDVRLLHAIYLIFNTDKKILDIAYESGFSDHKYLNQLIKNLYGCTASNMRKFSDKLNISVPDASIGSIHLAFNVQEVLNNISLKQQTSGR